MGYLFLAISLLAGSTKGFCGKKTSGFLTEYKDAMFINFIRMLFCVVIGLAVMLFGGNIKSLAIDGKTLFITACSGITTSFFVVSWLVSVKRGAYMMLDVFLMLGVIVTIFLSCAVYGETVKTTQIIGLAVLLVSVKIMCSYNNSIKSKMSMGSFLLLVLCGVSNGLTDFSQKMFVKSSADANIAVFNFYTYVFSAVSLLIFYFIFKLKFSSGGASGKDIFNKIVIYVLIMSVCLYAASYFKTKAALYLSSAELYPLSQGMSLILSSLMSAFLFKEKLTIKCIIGIITAFAALLIINVL